LLGRPFDRWGRRSLCHKRFRGDLFQSLRLDLFSAPLFPSTFPKSGKAERTTGHTLDGLRTHQAPESRRSLVV
jgi:hypothetical protein